MSLTIYRRGSVWHYRGTVAGRRLRGTTRTQDKRTAQRIAAEIEAQEWKCRLDGPESVLTFAQAAILYRDAGRWTRGLEAVEDYWKDTPVIQITEGAVKQASVMHKGAPARNRLFISPTQAVINHAASLELCPKLSVQRFRHEPEEKTPAYMGVGRSLPGRSEPALECYGHVHVLDCRTARRGRRPDVG